MLQNFHTFRGRPKRHIAHPLGRLARATAARSMVALLSGLMSIAAMAGVPMKLNQPFLELVAGPGRGYPGIHAIEHGETVEVTKRKTDWYKVQTADGKSGWVHADTMSSAFEAAGYRLPDNDGDEARFELGMTGGDFGGAATIGVYGALALTPNVSLKASGQKILGDFSDGWIGSVDVVMQPFPHWRFSPYLTLGGGMIGIEPQTSLVASQDRTDEMAHVGVGVRTYLARRFVLRAEYESYQIFTSRNDNEEIDQWLIGFSAYF